MFSCLGAQYIIRINCGRFSSTKDILHQGTFHKKLRGKSMKMKSHQNEESFFTRDVLENSSPFLDVEICHETKWNCDSLWGTPSELTVVVCPCIHTCDGWWQKWIVEVSGQHTLNGMFMKRNLKKQRYVLKAFITIYQKLSDGRLLLTTMYEVTSPVGFLQFKTRICWLLFDVLRSYCLCFSKCMWFCTLFCWTFSILTHYWSKASTSVSAVSAAHRSRPNCEKKKIEGGVSEGLKSFYNRPLCLKLCVRACAVCCSYFLYKQTYNFMYASVICNHSCGQTSIEHHKEVYLHLSDMTVWGHLIRTGQRWLWHDNKWLTCCHDRKLWWQLQINDSDKTEYAETWQNILLPLEMCYRCRVWNITDMTTTDTPTTCRTSTFADKDEQRFLSSRV